MDSQTIDRVREANNIVDVISTYVPLKRSGANYKGLCPFHEDRNPSMMVSEVKQIFKCFVCGKGGNVFTFVQEYEKITFPEAVRKLAQRVGIAIEETADDKRVVSKRTKLLNLYRIANEFYVNNLKEHGEHIYKYLEDRSISKELAHKLEIGYALNSGGSLFNLFKKKDVDIKLMEDSGLVKNSQRGHYDLFKDRVMFPIHSHSGQIIAFGGRVLSSNQPGGKYVNSPTTDIYTKGNELYGLFLTKYDISKKNFALVCEGYMDFLRLHTEGFTNSVASLGTALTEKQLSILSRYSKNIYLIYDGDTAGRKATVSAGLKALSMGLTPLVVQLPDGEDPDSYILKAGVASLQSLIDEALPFLKFAHETSYVAKETKDKVKILSESVATIKNAIDKELLVKEIAEEFAISERSIYSSMTGTRRRSTDKVKPDFSLEKFIEEREFIQYLLNNPSEIKNSCQELNSNYFFVDLYKKMFISLTKDNGLIFLDSHSQIIDFFEDENLKNKAAELILMGVPGRNILLIINDVKLRKLKYDLQEVNRQIGKEGATTYLVKEKNNIKNKIQQLDIAIVNNLLT